MNKDNIWLRFIHWHGWRDFIHWKGWSAFVHWKGWKPLLFPHPAVIALLCIAATAALLWVFLGGREQTIPAYISYAFSSYAMITFCLITPKIYRACRKGLYANALTNRVLTDRELQFRTKLYVRQIIDLVYGAAKTLAGVFYSSSWLITDGLYNLVQGGIELLQILRRKKVSNIAGQWKSYRLCGWLVLVMQLFMTGPIFLMINRGKGNYYSEILVIATAAFAFYKLTFACVGVAKDRQHKAPIDSSVRLLNLTQALFSLFSLQVSMFHTFGAEFESQQIMNNLTGGAVCILVILIGIYMLRRAARELKKLS